MSAIWRNTWFVHCKRSQSAAQGVLPLKPPWGQLVMIYLRLPLSLRDVEGLLFQRGIYICHEIVRHGAVKGMARRTVRG